MSLESSSLENNVSTTPFNSRLNGLKIPGIVILTGVVAGIVIASIVEIFSSVAIPLTVKFSALVIPAAPFMVSCAMVGIGALVYAEIMNGRPVAATSRFESPTDGASRQNRFVEEVSQPGAAPIRRRPNPIVSDSSFEERASSEGIANQAQDREEDPIILNTQLALNKERSDVTGGLSPEEVKELHPPLQEFEDALQVVNENGLDLADLGDTLRGNREIVLAAVRQNAHALRCALGGLDDDEEVVRVAVRENGRALQYASDRIRKDKNFVLEVVGFEGCALEYALGDLRSDPEIIRAAVEQNGYTLRYAVGLEKLPEEERREIILKAVRQAGYALEYAGDLRSDPEIIEAAVRRNGIALRWADLSSCLSDQKHQIVLAAVQKDRRALQFAGDLRNHPKISQAAAIRTKTYASHDPDSSVCSTNQKRQTAFAPTQRNRPAFELADKIEAPNSDFESRQSLNKEFEEALRAKPEDATPESRQSWWDDVFEKGLLAMPEVPQGRPVVKPASEAAVKNASSKSHQSWVEVFEKGLLAMPKVPQGRPVVKSPVKDSSSKSRQSSDERLEAAIRSMPEVPQGRPVVEDTTPQVRLFDAIKNSSPDNPLSPDLMSQIDFSDIKGFTRKLIWQEREHFLAIVEEDGLQLAELGENARRNRAISLTAVRQNPLALRYVLEDLDDDDEIVQSAIERDGCALQYASERIRKDKGFVLEAVSFDGRALEYALGGLQSDPEIIRTAVKQNGLALRYADWSRCSSDKKRQIVGVAVRQNGYALEFAGDLAGDREILSAAVKQNPAAAEKALVHKDNLDILQKAFSKEW